MITVAGLHKAMGGKPVLQGVDLEIAKGESCVIITAIPKCLGFVIVVCSVTSKR